MKKRILISVSNDLATDQRVRKQCSSLVEAGFEVSLYGRLLKDSLPLQRSYQLKRLALPFKRGPLFYASLNIALFFVMLFKKTDVFYANDLDTLPANCLLAVLRGKILVYDSHEYFTEVPEIQDRKWVKRIWKLMETACISRCRLVLTVNRSIAKLLETNYSIGEVMVARNVPERSNTIHATGKESLKIAADDFMLVLQGSGINIDRGGEELVQAMKFLDRCVLVIIGGGDALPVLKVLADESDMADKVRFYPKMAFDAMMAITASADLGLSLDKDTNLNYKFSLPNKLFDYASAGIPVLVSDLVEVQNLVMKYGIGEVCYSHKPIDIAQSINRLRNNPSLLLKYKQNALRMTTDLNWESEYRPVIEKLHSLAKN